MKYAALVIALNKYDNNPDLINALNDGKAMADKFRELKYDVVEVFEPKATHKDYADALSHLMELDFNNHYDAIILYFSGHGFMTNMSDYLALQDCSKLEEHQGLAAATLSVRLQDFIEKMRSRYVTKVIAILDACRDDLSDYAAVRGRRGMGDYLSSKFGSSSAAPCETFIAYSTTASMSASDGGAASVHSRYTAALLEEIAKPIPIEQVFKNVRRRVHLRDKDQLPWEHTCLTDEFYFNYGQMDPYYNSPYPRECYEDSRYSSFNPTVSSMLQRLMSPKESERGRGILKLLMEGRAMSSEDHFVTGRVIMRQAIAGSDECKKFITNRRLERFKRGRENDLVNGMLYELYFDSDNSYRPKQINDLTLLNSLNYFAHDDYCQSSVKFIKQVLEERNQNPPYRLGDGLIYHVIVFVKRTDYHTTDGGDIFYIHSVNFKQHDIKENLELEPYLIEPRDLRNEISRQLQIPPIQLRVKIPSMVKHLLNRDIPDRFEEMVFDALVRESIDEVDQLGTSGYTINDCSVMSINDIQVEEDYIKVDGKCEASFDIISDEDTFSMSFPGSFELELQLENGEWKNIKHNCFSFDTSRYYN